MSTYPIPSTALDDRLAIVGTSGSGKTYAAGTAVERLLETGAKVVVVDPLGVWWGLRVKANGKDQAFPVILFGGDEERADIEIDADVGGLIGEAVAHMKESCVVSLTTLGSKSAERRFMLAFLEALYRNATREPFHIIFDEADLWAPQRAIEPQLQALMENIVRRGRVKGFVPWLITQRPAVISKDVLSQVDGLIAMKLTSSQDRDALQAWIEGQADKADEKRILARLPKLQRGEGVVWIPGRDVLREATFPKKDTFDSSATPKRGEPARKASLKPLDTAALVAQIEAIAEQRCKPGRPPKAKGTHTNGPDDVVMTRADFEAARQDSFNAGFAQGQIAERTEIQPALDAATRILNDMREKSPGMGPQAQSQFQVLPHQPVAPSQPAARRSAALAAPQPSTRVQPIAVKGGTDLGPAAAEMLHVAQSKHPVRFNWGQLAALTGRKARGGSFNTAKRTLVDGGHVQEVGGLVVPSLTENRPLPTGAELLTMWLQALPSPADELLKVISSSPRGIGVADLAQRTGRQPRGGSWNGAISILRRNGLIREVSRGVFAINSLTGDGT